jgi:hypothetical protein
VKTNVPIWDHIGRHIPNGALLGSILMPLLLLLIKRHMQHKIFSHTGWTFLIWEKEVIITSQYALVKGELQLPIRDLCGERDSKNTYEVAGVSQHPSASANTLVGCITLIEMQIISLPRK